MAQSCLFSLIIFSSWISNELILPHSNNVIFQNKYITDEEAVLNLTGFKGAVSPKRVGGYKNSTRLSASSVDNYLLY